MDTALAEAFIHGRHTVCGFELAPYTLRHDFALEAIGSPLALAADDTITYSDLFKAARICSAPDEAALQALLLSSADEPADVSKEDALAHYEAWNVYLRNYTTSLKLMETRGGGSYEIKCPSFIIACRLIKNGFRPQEAWWTPYGAARSYSLGFADLDPNASFKILDEKRREQLRKLGHAV